ncbi:N-acetyltransferase family protein [Parabacteroides sp.]
MIIRLATKADVDSIADLYSAIHSEEESGAITVGWNRDIYPTRQTAVDGIQRGDLFVLEDNDEIVATAIINQQQVACYANGNWHYNAPAEKVMVLHTLVVAPKGKGHGYGTAFVKYYERYALAHDCPYLRLDTQDINVIARKLYAKLGYSETDIISVSDGFNGLPNIRLVLLEKEIQSPR